MDALPLYRVLENCAKFSYETFTFSISLFLQKVALGELISCFLHMQDSTLC